MSDRANLWAWELFKAGKIKTANDFVALKILCEYTDPYDNVEVRSRKEWATMIGVSTDTFDRRIRNMASFIKIERQKSKRGFGPSIYRLQIPNDFSSVGSRKASARSQVAASRKAAYSEPETTPSASEAADLRLAASGAASQEVSSTELYPDRPELAETAAVVVAATPSAQTLCERIVAEINSPWLDPQKSLGLATSEAKIHRLVAAGADMDRDVIPVIRRMMAARRTLVHTWAYFDAAIREAAARRKADEEQPITPIQPAARVAGVVEPIHGNGSRNTYRSAAERNAAASAASLESWNRVLGTLEGDEPLAGGCTLA